MMLVAVCMESSVSDKRNMLTTFRTIFLFGILNFLLTSSALPVGMEDDVDVNSIADSSLDDRKAKATIVKEIIEDVHKLRVSSLSKLLLWIVNVLNVLIQDLNQI